jgi:hypothetical protein
MTLQEIIKSIDDLPPQDQTSLFHLLERRLAPNGEPVPTQSNDFRGETFWEGVLRFRATIEREGIEFTDEDFAGLRDRSPGRELEL